MIIAGSSGTGKTTFVRAFLRDYRFTTDISKPLLNVLYYYGQEQALFDVPVSSHVNIKYVRGYSDEHEDQRPDILVIDDLMTETGDDKRLSALFTKGSHHLGISVLFLVQNLFHKGKEMRTISLNSQYIVAMNNPRDRLQLLHLGRQILPGKSEYFSRVVNMAFSEPFSHVMIDMSPSCPNDYRLRQRACVKGVQGYNVFLPK